MKSGGKPAFQTPSYSQKLMVRKAGLPPLFYLISENLIFMIGYSFQSL